MYALNKLLSSLLFVFNKGFYLRFIGLLFGKECRFIDLRRSTFGSEPFLIRLGDHVTISSNVHFVTHDGGAWVLRNLYPNMDLFGPIVVGNNVFIGMGTTILPGTIIEDNVVVGAGSIVRGRLYSNYIYAGIPAKKIKSLSQYAENALIKCDHTKSMSFFEKKRFLISKYVK